MKDVYFFFDYECPYCLRGYAYLKELLPEYRDIRIVWSPCEAHPRPEDHHPHTDLCMQAMYYAMEQGIDMLAYHDRMFKAVHEDHIDVENVEVLADCLSDMIKPEELKNVLESGRYAGRQQEGNSFAYEENKVWFIPTLVCGEDRLDAEGGAGITREALKAYLDGLSA